MNPQTAHGLRIVAAAVAVVSVALWQGLTHRYRPILERSTQVKLDASVDVASITWIDGHTALGKCGDDLPCIFDTSTHKLLLLPRVPIDPIWDDLATSKHSLDYKRGEISPDKKVMLWKVSSGVVRIPLTRGLARQIVTYPKAWLERNKRLGRSGGYPGPAGYPGSASASSPAVPTVKVPDPDWVESILWLADSRYWLSIESSGTGPYLLRLRDFNGHIVNQINLPGFGPRQYWKLLGRLPGNRALLRAGEKSLLVIDVDRGLTAQKFMAVTPPSDCYVEALSQDGRRLLWEGGVEPTNNRWSNEIKARLGDDGRYHFTSILAVTDLDGKNARELCREEPGINGPHAVQWTTDSKHITFVMNKKLWMLPVP